MVVYFEKEALRLSLRAGKYNCRLQKGFTTDEQYICKNVKKYLIDTQSNKLEIYEQQFAK